MAVCTPWGGAPGRWYAPFRIASISAAAASTDRCCPASSCDMHGVRELWPSMRAAAQLCRLVECTAAYESRQQVEDVLRKLPYACLLQDKQVPCLGAT